MGGKFEPGPPASSTALFPGSIPNPVSPQNFTAYLNRTLTEAVVDEGVSAQVKLDDALAEQRQADIHHRLPQQLGQVRRGHRRHAGRHRRQHPDNNYTKFPQFSQELQYSGHTSRFDWQVGGFLSHEVLDSGTETQSRHATRRLCRRAFDVCPAAGLSPGEGAIDKYHQVEQGEALYTQDTFHVTDKLLITGGLRYTWEHKDLTTNYSNTDTTNLCANVLQGGDEAAPRRCHSPRTGRSRRPAAWAPPA